MSAADYSGPMAAPTPDNSTPDAPNPINEGMTVLNGPDPSTSTGPDQITPNQQQAAPPPVQQGPNGPGSQDDQEVPRNAKPSLWRTVLAGALQGLAAGASQDTRGLSGGAGFAKGLGAGANQVLNAVPQQQAALDQSKAETAYHYANLSKIQQEIHLMPDSRQADFLDKTADQSESMLKAGAITPLSQPTDVLTAQKALQQLHSQNPWAVYSVMPVRGDDGTIKYSAVQFTKAPLQTDLKLSGGGDNGADITIPAGTPSDQVGKYYTNYLAKQLDAQTKTGIASGKNSTALQVQGMKGTQAADRAAASNTGDWLPKVSADEKKKAELAENIAFNANEVSSVIMRRPDLFGPAAGRITNIEQMTGNNDPDISALATHIHNMAMANSGVHGFRSQEGVQAYENQLLNNFKNGPKAVAGALRASVGSVQTFIDDARPRTYRTHSTNGGAIRGMMNQGGQ